MARTDLPTAEEIRESFAAEPGKGHLAEAALAERANLVAYGADTSAVDKRLAALGLGPAATAAGRKATAAERKAALEEITSGTGRSGADPAPPGPPEAPEAPEAPDSGGGQASPGAASEPASEPAGDAAASGEPGQGDDAKAGDGDGDGAAKARKTVTPGRKPGGPKATT